MRDDSFFLEVVVPVVLAFLFVLGLFTLVFQLGEAANHDDCHDNGKLLNAQVTYRKWDGCYVNYNNLWMPLDVYVYNRDHGFVK